MFRIDLPPLIHAEAPGPGEVADWIRTPAVIAGVEHVIDLLAVHTDAAGVQRAATPELDEMLDLAGFPCRKYYFPVNGWFEQTNAEAVEIFHQVRGGPGYNFCIAARNRERFEAVFGRERAEAGLRGIARKVSYAIGRRFLNLYRRLGAP